MLPERGDLQKVFTMAGFEQAFDDVEQAAEAARKAAARLASTASALKKAAREGNVAAIRRGPDRLGEAIEGARQEVERAAASWPFSENEEAAYLKDGYAAELQAVSAEKGLSLYERDGQLISPPSILKILPDRRSVMLDRKTRSTIRPSWLAELLLRSKGKSSGFTPAQFLEALYVVYADITGSSALMPKQGGGVVPLARVYRLMTALPGIGRNYDRMDFGRDLYILDSKGPRRTRKGAEVAFSSSGGKYRPRDIFYFVDPDGASMDYYGIRFRENCE